MYIVHDRLTPHIQEYMHATRIKNIVLRYWPTKVVNGVVVLDLLMLYVRSQGVIDTPGRRKLYNLLGIDVEELRKQDWEGIDDYYVYWQRVVQEYTLNIGEIKTYIESNSTYSVNGVDNTSPWMTGNIKYQPVHPVNSLATDAEIISYIKNPISDGIVFATESYDELTNITTPVNKLLGMALLDSANAVFDVIYTVEKKTLKRRDVLQGTSNTLSTVLPLMSAPGSTTYSMNNNYVLEANIKVQFRRKNNIDVLAPEINTFLEMVKRRLGIIHNQTNTDNYFMDTISPIELDLYQLGTKRNVSSKENSINASLINMYEDITPVTNDDIYMRVGRTTYVKKAGLEAMKAKDFVVLFAKSIKTGYSEEDASFLEKALAVVVAIVVIVASAGYGLAAVGTLLGGAATSTVVFVFASTFALALAIGTFLAQGLALLVGNAGYLGFAAYLNKVVNFLGVVSTIAGIVSIYSAFKMALAKQVAAETLAKEALAEAGKEVTTEAVMELASMTISSGQIATVAIKEVAISEVGLRSLYETAKTMLLGSAKMTLMDVLNKTVSAVNWAGNYFMQKDLVELQGELTAQQEKSDELKQEYEKYKGSVDKVYYSTSEMYDGYYNPYFNDFELSTGEGPDRIWATKAHWRCQNSIDGIFPK